MWRPKKEKKKFFAIKLVVFRSENRWRPNKNKVFAVKLVGFRSKYCTVGDQTKWKTRSSLQISGVVDYIIIRVAPNDVTRNFSSQTPPGREHTKNYYWISKRPCAYFSICSNKFEKVNYDDNYLFFNHYFFRFTIMTIPPVGREVTHLFGWLLHLRLWSIPSRHCFWSGRSEIQISGRSNRTQWQCCQRPACHRYDISSKKAASHGRSDMEMGLPTRIRAWRFGVLQQV